MRADCREGDIGTELGEVAKAHPEVMIGSYPFVDDRGPNTNVVVRARDPAAPCGRQGGGGGHAESVRARLAAQTP